MKKGSATIEVMLILPILLGIIILGIDFMFMTYQRARAVAEIETVRINMCEQFAQATDQSINAGASDLVSGNVPVNTQTDRGFMDAFHIFLSSDSVSQTFKRGVSAQAEGYTIGAVSSRYKFNLLSPAYIISYEVTVDSPFQKVTHRLLSPYGTLQGEVKLPLNSYFQQMNTTEIIINRIERIKEIEEIIKTVRRIISDWTSKL